MANSNNGGQSGTAPAGNPQGLPQVNVLGQYVKDFSFENPNAPQSLQPSQQPGISLHIQVNSRNLSATDVEVSLQINGKADAGNTLLFNFELDYAGIFRIQNVPQENIAGIVQIECPRLLFPFAREIISAAVRNGGFPPLMIDPVDFATLYQQKMGHVPNPAPAN